MKRKPVESTTTPAYPSVTDIERDRRGFLRLFGKILAGVFVMGPLARAALADDEPKPVVKGDMKAPKAPKAPEPPKLGGRVAPPKEPFGFPNTGGGPRPPAEPGGVLCDPKKGDCGKKDPPKHSGTKIESVPPEVKPTAGEAPRPEEPTLPVK